MGVGRNKAAQACPELVEVACPELVEVACPELSGYAQESLVEGRSTGGEFG